MATHWASLGLPGPGWAWLGLRGLGLAGPGWAWAWLGPRLRLLGQPSFLLFALLAGLAAGNHWETQKVALVVAGPNVVGS